MARHHEGELVKEALGVLDDSDHAPRRAAGLVPEVTDLEPEIGSHAVGHGHLSRAGRIVTGDEGEHGLPERPVRILGAQVVGVDRTGNGHDLVLDDLDAAEPVPQRGGLGRQFRVGSLERGEVLGGTETRVGGRRRVGCHGRTQNRGSDRHNNQRHDQQLLPPFTPEQAPGPAEHGAARRRASVA